MRERQPAALETEWTTSRLDFATAGVAVSCRKPSNIAVGGSFRRCRRAPRLVESWRQLEGVNVVPAFRAYARAHHRRRVLGSSSG